MEEEVLLQPSFPQKFNWVVNPSFLMEKMASGNDLNPFLDMLKFPPICTPMFDNVLNSKNIFLTLDENNNCLDNVAVLGWKGLGKETPQLMKLLEKGQVVYALTNGWNEMVQPYNTVEDVEEEEEEVYRKDLKLQVWVSFLEDTKMLMCIFIDDEEQQAAATAVQQAAASVSSTSTQPIDDDIQTSNNSGSSKVMIPRRGHWLREGQFMPLVLLQKLRNRLQNNLNAVTWLGKKILTVSDADTHQNRLYLPRPSELKLLMTTNEIKDAGKQAGVEVVVIDDNGNEWELKLRFWKPSFALTGDNWKLIKSNLGLKAKMQAEVWIFRGPISKLCFALSFKKENERDEVEEEDPSDSLEEQEGAEAT